MSNFKTRTLKNKSQKSISDYILFPLVVAIITLWTLYAFGEEQRLAEEQGISVNQLK